MLVRFNWGEGFRAPSIGELYGTASRFDQEVTDPCSNLLAQPANVQANCINNGVPSNGSYTQLNPQLPVITSGNPSLQPETSEGYNIGLVWQPSFWANTAWSDRISFELNYSNIELDGAIKAQDGQSLLDRCAQTGDALACGTIARTATGTVSAISNPLINIGGLETQAIDFTVNWSLPETSLGTFTVRSSTNFLLEFNELVPTSSGIVAIAREGTERGSPDQAYPEVKSTLTLDWDRNTFGGSITARYISQVDEAGAANSLNATTYWDLQGRWSPAMLDDRVTIALGINNVTDEDPPGCITCGLNNFDPTTYDAPGRFGYIRFSYRQ
ncbi:MAG: TonB-dependent receptor [Alphaproteobacteria bacterium]|nr:TonB-dependent receptor [Alphaproteobacteria bacterium]